ncbi:STAS domain-containing protein [Bradyrhizobium sp.]|jgi:anti-anti-sigma factor|uniref:STAS domain-containing protein n=1 Tax=Bradyrhizobium sp. TaxID=376 RepID=UPI003C27377C
MKFEFQPNDARVTLSGEFTFTDHVAFREVADRLLQADDRTIVVELSQLRFIDSAGLGMLLIARDEAGKAGRTLVLSQPQGQVKRMFAVTKFDELFTIQA